MGEPVLQDAVPITNSLYCFTVYTEDTGTTTPNEELPILKYMLSKKTSIFACPEYDVFGDVEVEVGPDLKTVMFKQVWKAIGSGDKYKTASWVVKVDVDAVFLPSRLTKKLESQMVPANGIYLENCKYVNYGYFGNLE